MPAPHTDPHVSLRAQPEFGAAAVRVQAPIRRVGGTQSVGWAGTVLPLSACAAIWGIGDASATDVVWLTVAHDVIGTAASVWTVLQLGLKWRAPRAPRKAASSWPKPTLAVIYTLLVLQPLLAIAGAMLHGDHASLFGIGLPSILPVDQHAALQVSRLKGGNALLLLALIALHLGNVLPTLRWRSRQETGQTATDDGITCFSKRSH